VEISHPPVNGFDRNAYQREYMRVWRAVRGGRACLLKGGNGRDLARH
jgi:hypothetical protein